MPLNFDAGFHLEILAQRDDVERGIIERAIEDKAPAIDRELLAEGKIGAVDRADRAAPVQRARRRRRDPDTPGKPGFDALAGERQRTSEIDFDIECERQVACAGIRAATPVFDP